MSNLRSDIRVGLDAKDARSGLQRLRGDFAAAGADIDRTFGGRLGGALDGVTSRVSGLSGLAGTLGPVGAAGAAAAAGVAALGTALVGTTAAAFEFTRRQAGVIAETRQLAANLGVGVEQFSALSTVAARYGATSEDVADAIKDLSVRAVENEKEFTELGISVRDTQGNLLQGIPLYERVADGIRGMSDATSQAAAADILASDAGVRQIEVLRLGSQAVREQTQAVIDQGGAIDETTALLEREFTLALGQAGVEVETLKRLFAEELLPVFTPLIQAFNRFVALNRDELGAAVQAGAVAIGNLVDIALAGAQAGNALAEAFINVGQTITVPGLLGAFDGVEATLEGSGTAIAGFREQLRLAREELANIGSGDVGPPAPGGGNNPDLGAQDRADKDAAAAIARREALNDELRALELSLGDERNRIAERFDALRKRNAKEFVGITRAINEDLINAAADAAREELRIREETAREVARASLLAQVEVANDDPVARIREQEQAKLQALREGLEEQLITVQEYQALRNEVEREGAEQRTAIEERAAQQQVQAIIQQSQQFTQVGSQIASNLVALANQRTDQEIAALERSGAAEAEIQAQREQLEREAFERTKALRLVEAVINTAAGVTQALASSPPPASFILAGLVAAAGAIQIATIASSQYQGGAGSVQAPSAPPDAETLNGRNDDRRFANDEEGDGRGGTIVQVNFNTPVNSRRAAREIRDTLRGTG